MTKAGERIIAAAKEIRDTVWLRGGPGKDYPCDNPNMLECAAWECQKDGRCRMRVTGEVGRHD